MPMWRRKPCCSDRTLTWQRAVTSCRYDPTALIATLDDAQAVAETLLSMSSVGFGGAQARPATDNGMWEDLALRR
jgi:hypothetical protein